MILVAQSFRGFTAPLVCAQATLRGLIFVNAMIPLPAETAGSWWDNTGAVEARVAAARDGGYSSTSTHTYFLHDVPEAVLRAGPASPRTVSAVRRALENKGFEFLPGTAEHAPGVRLIGNRPNLIR